MARPLLITNGTVVTWQPGADLIEKGAVYVENGLIGEVGTAADLEAKYPDAERLDARGQLIMPGNICAHTPSYGAFARGMAIPGPAPKDFPVILAWRWWLVYQALDVEAVWFRVLVLLLDVLKVCSQNLINQHA